MNKGRRNREYSCLRFEKILKEGEAKVDGGTIYFNVIRKAGECLEKTKIIGSRV